LVEIIGQIQVQNESVATTTEEQAYVSKDIAKGIQHMFNESDATVTSADSTLAASRALKTSSAELMQSIEKFVIR
jgi:methyl-accepting chemotaxis protein